MDLLKSGLRVAVALAVIVPLLIFVAQASLIYFPRDYADYSAYLRRVEHLKFENRGKAQTAFLLNSGGDGAVERVWWFFGGNGALALDWLSLAENLEKPGIACVLVDYPGYGLCEGRANPRSIRRSVDALFPVVAEHLGMTEETLKGRSAVLGHSLGAAVALDTAARYELDFAVVISPFTTMKKMATRTVGPVLSNLLTHRYDNVESLNLLANSGRSGVRVHLFHGREDEIVPFAMGRQLAGDFSGIVRFHPVDGAGHNDIFGAIEPEIRTLLTAGTP